MVPENFTSLALPGKTPSEAVQIYFDSQYPNTNDCALLEVQLAGISEDLKKINPAIVRHKDFPYSIACAVLWNSKKNEKRKLISNKTCTMKTTNPNSGTVLISDLTNQTPGNAGAPKNPNAPDGSGTTQTSANNGTGSVATKSIMDYFTRKNLLIGGGIITALAVIGFVVVSKNKK